MIILFILFDTTNSIYREIKKNSVNDTLKRFLEKTKEF